MREFKEKHVPHDDSTSAAKSCHLPEATNRNNLLRLLSEKWISYKPLIIVLIFTVLLTVAQSFLLQPAAQHSMYFFMGYFFIFLALFKFFDWQGFVEGFATYDIVTQHLTAYGYAYPLIELSLGLCYLMNIAPLATNIITVIIMTISGIGVVKSMWSGQKIKCACLGSVLNVPLSAVSVLENVGMGVMAAYMLICA